MMYILIDMFKYHCIQFFGLAEQCISAVSNVTIVDPMHVCKVDNCPSSVPERRQGVQSGPEVPSWRWLQHMVNFHNYSLSMYNTNYYVKEAHLFFCMAIP